MHDHIASLVAYKSASSQQPPTVSPVEAWPLPVQPPQWAAYNTSFNPTRPLSPILSPVGGSTPAAGSPVKKSFDPVPPQVPPKTGIIIAAPITPPPRKVCKVESVVDPILIQDQESLKPRPSLPVFSPEALQSPEAPTFPIQSNVSLSPRHERSHSPKIRAMVPEPPLTPIMERGRPIIRTKSGQNLRAAFSLKEEFQEFDKLPTGLRPFEASAVLPNSEKASLAKQASSQAERFEILGKDQVSSLSKELRALDERCEYLRKNYRSLRLGRQKLHTRLLSYLKSEALSFSKDRLLKQEEALVELDRAIDDWATKLERAENRRLRVRQKLLEHVAAAMMLNVGAAHGAAFEPTPPGSREGYVESSPSRLGGVKDRSDVESIKIYADTQVLNLFSDIEQAIGRMCEAAC
jgi:Uds1 (Up-regulated during septation)-like protein